MIVSIGGVLALSAWCFARVFRSKGTRGESAIELITPDMEEYDANRDQ